MAEVEVKNPSRPRRPRRIDRIPLRGETSAHVVHVDSPSLFWIRLPNHVTDAITRDFRPQPLAAQPQLFQYVFAPTEQGEMRRSRVSLLRRNQHGELFALMHYIDCGGRQWVAVDALKDINPSALYYQPWQTVACCLFGVEPKEGDKWSAAAVNLFRSFVLDPETTKQIKVSIVDPQHDKLREKETSWTFRADVKVCLHEGEGEWESLATALSAAADSPFKYNKRMKKPLEQKIFEEVEMPEYERAPPDTPAPWQLRSEADALPLADQMRVISLNADLDAGVNELLAVEADAHRLRSTYPSVQIPHNYPSLDKRESTQSGFDFWAEDCTVGPDEFYVHPLTDGTTSAIEAFDAQLGELCKRLDAFYGDARRRRQLPYGAVGELRSGRPSRVFAVTRRKDKYATYTGVWQRCELLYFDAASSALQLMRASATRDAEDDATGGIFKIRYVDVGGMDVRTLEALFELDASFTDEAMVMPCALAGIAPKGEPSNAFRQGPTKRWSLACCDYFKTLLRTDVPQRATLLLQNDTARMADWKSKSPNAYPGVFHLLTVTVSDPLSGQKTTIMDRLMSRDLAVLADVNVPE